MKIKSFSTIAAALLSSAAFLPQVAQASPENSVLLAQQYNTPQIDSFTVDRVNRLTPGSKLTFTLEGTPNSRATLTIGNVARNITMQEIEPGVYQGRYTIRSADRFSENTIVRANLQRGDRISSARLQQPLVTGYANNDYPTNDRTNQSLSVENFSVQPVDRLEPGTQLDFTLNGTPNARATFSIDGIAYNQPMREVSPGTYRGEYVIRRQDNISNSGIRATARLQSRGEVVSANLDRNLVASNGYDRYNDGYNYSNSQLPLEIITPEYNSRISGRTVEVRGRSAPNTTVNVNVRAANSLGGFVGLQRDIFSRSIQTDNSGYFSFNFEPSIVIPGTRYEVNLNASNGNRTNEETLVLFQQ